ncbi:hypothetical protein DPMN_088841 [Dreissena polymorpha]|uniref:Uncharacterized protein n=1 Tax=Dreissena polymorpha TaxID=45954 RepID=A0A9D4QWW0_DREPO|nr:hypothetical protein DPMN_088841 [Dreissena polymorpha]
MWPLEKNAPPLGSHVFQANVTIFKLIQDIIETNLLTKFHKDWTINVASRVLTRKNAPPPGGHVFKATKTIFEHIQDIIGTNLLTKFHEDRKINVASRVITRKNAPPPGGYVFQPTSIIFELFQDIIWINLLTKKNAPPLDSHVFQANVTIFEHIQDIIETNLLAKFHEDWTINVASRVLTRFSQGKKTAPPPGGHVFQAITSIYELAKNVTFRVKMTPPGCNKTTVLTKFHEDWTKNVTSRVFTCFHYIHLEKTAPPPGGHVFSPIWTIFEFSRDINETNVLTKFHDDWAKILTSITGTIFQLNQHIIKTYILIKLHEDWTSNVTSTHDPVSNSVEFHEDWTINVASINVASQGKMLTTDDAQRTKGDHKSSP